MGGICGRKRKTNDVDSSHNDTQIRQLWEVGDGRRRRRINRYALAVLDEIGKSADLAEKAMMLNSQQEYCRHVKG